MSAEKEKRYISGEVVNSISRSFMVETDSSEFPKIDLVRNSITVELNPLLKEIGLFAQLKMEVIDGPYGKVFLITELTRASARAAYERTYANLLAEGRTTIPAHLSAEIPPTITLEQLRTEQAAAAEEAERQAFESLPHVLRPVPRTSAILPGLLASNQNGPSNGKAESNGSLDSDHHGNGPANGHANGAHNHGRSNGANDEQTLWRLTPEGGAITAGD